MGYRNIKKQKKLFLFFKLRILIFQCPGTTRITNFTRMHQLYIGEALKKWDLGMFPKQGGRVIPKLNVKFWWTLFIALVVAEYNATFSFCN